MAAPKKVLVADDDPTSRAIVEKLSQEFGVSVIHAADGAQAWRVLNDNPDIILLVTDVAMPELDGKDLVRRVRAEERFSALFVVFMSGVVGPKDIANLLVDGVNRFLPKPIDPRMFKDYLRVALDKAKAQSPNR